MNPIESSAPAHSAASPTGWHRVAWPGAAPIRVARTTRDGGLSLGQAWVAARSLQRS